MAQKVMKSGDNSQHYLGSADGSGSDLVFGVLRNVGNDKQLSKINS